MPPTIFYSWQADLPNATNRGFILQALENAVSALAADLAVEPVIERDTQNVPGAPDIARTIFGKIAVADVVVADVSFVDSASTHRRTPNPNVLIELGYALRALGEDRVVLVFNSAFGRVEDLPFDLKMRRAVVFDMPADATDRATERRRLAGILKEALKAALAVASARPVQLSPVDLAISAVENGAPNRLPLIRRAMADILDKLRAIAPPMLRADGTVEQLIDAINTTVPTVELFTRLAETLAGMNDRDGAEALFKALDRVLEGYNNPRGFSGTYYPADFDFWKFVGHELLVSLVAVFLRERRYDSLGGVLAETISLPNGPSGRSGPVTFEYVSQNLARLTEIDRQKQRLCFHADLLSARHGQNGPLNGVLAFDDFMAADYFLFLRAQLEPKTAPRAVIWRAWSSVYLEDLPRFLGDAIRRQNAEALAGALDLPNVTTLRERLSQRAGQLTDLWKGRWDSPLQQEDVDRIASR